MASVVQSYCTVLFILVEVIRATSSLSIPFSESRKRRSNSRQLILSKFYTRDEDFQPFVVPYRKNQEESYDDKSVNRVLQEDSTKYGNTIIGGVAKASFLNDEIENAQQRRSSKPFIAGFYNATFPATILEPQLKHVNPNHPKEPFCLPSKCKNPSSLYLRRLFSKFKLTHVFKRDISLENVPPYEQIETERPVKTSKASSSISVLHRRLLQIAKQIDSGRQSKRVKRQSGKTLADYLQPAMPNNKPIPASNNVGNLPKKDELQILYTKFSGKLLRISGEGRIHTVDKDHVDVFCVIQVKSVDEDHGDLIFKLRGEWTGFYIALDSRAHLYATTNANDPNTDFTQKYAKNSYDAYLSIHNTYIAFNDDGVPHSRKVKSPSNRRSHFLHRNLEDIDTTLRKKLKEAKPNFRITTTASTITPSSTVQDEIKSIQEIATLQTTSQTKGVSKTKISSLATTPPSRASSINMHTTLSQPTLSKNQQTQSPTKNNKHRRRKGCKKKRNRSKKRCSRKRHKGRHGKRKGRRGRKGKRHKKHRKNSNKNRRTRSIHTDFISDVLFLKKAVKLSLEKLDDKHIRPSIRSSEPSNKKYSSSFPVHENKHLHHQQNPVNTT